MLVGPGFYRFVSVVCSCGFMNMFQGTGVLLFQLIDFEQKATLIVFGTDLPGREA